MKGEAMQKTDMKETLLAPRRRGMWIGFGAVTVIAIAVVLWFAAQHDSHPKSRQHGPTATMADMPSAPNDNSTDSTAANADLQVELGPTHLKKPPVQPPQVYLPQTANTLT